MSRSGAAYAALSSVNARENLITPAASIAQTRIDLQNAINAATSAGAPLVIRGNFTIDTALYVPSGATIRGDGSAQIIAATGGYKMLISANAQQPAGSIPTATGITLRDFTIAGNTSGGSTQDSGIHLVQTTNSLVDNVTITGTGGDGLTIGNIHSGIVETCQGVTVRKCSISGVDRQGVALTDAKECTVEDNSISNVTAGSGVDLEINFAGQYILGNRITGNKITACNAGVTGAAVASPGSLGHRNTVSGNDISNVSSYGIEIAYDLAVIDGNTIENAGYNGIYTVNSSQVQGLIVRGNTVTDAGQAAGGTYAAILLNNTVHSAIQGNVIMANLANKINLLWNETGGSGYNVYTGNNGRQPAVPYTIASTSDASHNMISSAAMTYRHGGFVGVGKITTPSATTGLAPFNVPHGTAPTTPANGDVWTTSAGIFVQINGVTRSINLT